MKKIILFTAVITAAVSLFTACLTTAPVSGADTVVSGSSDAEDFIIDEKSLYEYDDNGLLVKEEFFENVDGIVEKTVIIYEYENNNLVSKKYFNKNNNLDEYKELSYGSDGRISKETEYRSDGSVKNYKLFEYSENSSYIKNYYKNDGKLYRYIIKKYDSNGKLIENSDYETDK
jgi:antitoxin component YwqK of YwqJK toxin-antitoxin module